MIGLTDPQSGVQAFDYNAEGELTQAALANGATTTNSYNENGQLTSTSTQAGSGVLQSFAYSYNDDGRITSETDAQSAQTSFDYDALGRLTSFDPPTQPATTYGYDAAGNRTEAGSATYDYNALNQLTSSSDGTDFSYDPQGRLTEVTNGGQTASYHYDPLDELTHFDDGSQSTSYTYDGIGRRATTTANGTTETTHYGDLSDAAIADTAADGSVLRSYTQGPGIQSPTQLPRGAKLRHYLLSAGQCPRRCHGAPRRHRRDQLATNLRPLGRAASGPAQRYGFLGTYERPSDPSSGLVGMGRRQYDPGNGGFTSEDPVIATLGFGVTANRFEYAADDPQNRTDLHGRNVCDPVHVGPVNVNPINTACEFADDPVGAACRAVTPIPTPFEDPVCEGASAVAGDAAGAAGDTASRVWGYIYKKALSLLSPPCAAAFKPIPATITRVLFGELPPCPPIEDGDPHSPEPPDETPVLPLPPPGSSPIGRPIFEPVPVYP